MDQRTARAPAGLCVLLSLWLIVSPFVLSFAGSTGMWVAVITGVIALVLAWIRYNSPASAPGLGWLIAILGLWLIVSPFLFGMAGVTALLWDYVVVGIGYIVFGAWSALGNRSMITP
jgi:hypothetical protein